MSTTNAVGTRNKLFIFGCPLYFKIKIYFFQNIESTLAPIAVTCYRNSVRSWIIHRFVSAWRRRLTPEQVEVNQYVQEWRGLDTREKEAMIAELLFGYRQIRDYALPDQPPYLAGRVPDGSIQEIPHFLSKAFPQLLLEISRRGWKLDLDVEASTGLRHCSLSHPSGPSQSVKGYHPFDIVCLCACLYVRRFHALEQKAM